MDRCKEFLTKKNIKEKADDIFSYIKRTQTIKSLVSLKILLQVAKYLALYIGCLSLFSTSNVMAQDNSGMIDWELYKSQSGVDIYMADMPCIDSSNGLYVVKIMIRLVNRNEKTALVSWEAERWFDNNYAPDNSRDEKVSFKIKLKPQEEIAGNCFDKSLSEYKRFLYRESVPQLTRLELNSLKVFLM